LKEKVLVNSSKSKEVGKILGRLKIRDSFHERPFLHLKATADIQFKTYLFAAGICHQTYTLYHPDKDLYGWDFMEYAFLKMIDDDSPLLDTVFLTKSTENTIKRELIKAFSYDQDALQCNLDRIDERTRMIKEMGTWLENDFGGSSINYLQATKQKLFHQGKGYYETLPELEAFHDPMKKKATFFLKLAKDAGVLTIEDKENLIPIMDYHMQRVLMRLGCIEIKDSDLYQSLRYRKPLDSDEEIRQPAIDAMRIIATESRHDLLVMNDFFWPHGRSCCNETMLCRNHHCEKDPCTFYQAVELTEHTHCVFEEVCKAAGDDHYAMLWQPIVDTHFY
jgi:hypothetical protein